MKCKLSKAMVVVVTLAVVCSCGGKDNGITVNADQLYGNWLKVGTQEYWSYRTDATGAKWDVSEGFSEDFPSYSYRWSVKGDELRYTTYGDTINVPITRTYKIISIDETHMVRDEEVARYTLVKVNNI